MIINKISEKITLLALLFTFSGLLVFKDSDKAIVAFFLISTVSSIFYYTKFDLDIKKLKHPPMIILLISCLFGIISYYTHGYSSRILRAYIATYIFLIAFPWELITKQRLVYLMLIGSIFSLFYTCYYSLVLEMSREKWPINAIPSATISASICMVSLILFKHSEKKINKNISLLSFFLALTSALLTETRGAWLALGVTLVLVLSSKVSFNKKSSLYILAGFLLLLTIHQPIKERVNQTLQEFTSIQSGNYNTSIGLRLQMWITASKLIEEKPIYGSGSYHRETLKHLYEENKVPVLIYKESPPHYHNQYLDTAVKGGVVGLTLLLLLIISPFLTVISKGNSTFYRTIVSSIVCIYSISSLTDVAFNHGQSIIIFLMLTIPLSYMTDDNNYV